MGSAAVKMTNHNHPQLTRHSEAKCAIERGDTTRLSEVLQSCEELQPILRCRPIEGLGSVASGEGSRPWPNKTNTR